MQTALTAHVAANSTQVLAKNKKSFPGLCGRRAVGFGEVSFARVAAASGHGQYTERQCGDLLGVTCHGLYLSDYKRLIDSTFYFAFSL